MVQATRKFRRGNAYEEQKRQVAESLLTDVPESFEAAWRRAGFETQAGLAGTLNRNDPSPFLRKYGGALATADRIEAVERAFQAYRRTSGGPVHIPISSLRYRPKD